MFGLRTISLLILLSLIIGTVSAATLIVNTSNATDGFPVRGGTGLSWADIRNGAGTGVSTTNVWNILQLTADTTTDTYTYNARPAFIFDTSGIPDDATITSAKISLRGISYNNANLMNGNVSIVKFNIDGDITADDYDNFDYTKLATDAGSITGMWDTKYYNWTFNSMGLSNISKTGNSGFGLLFAADVNNVTPTWVSGAYNRWYSSAYDLGTNPPLLTVDYTSGENTITTHPLMYINESRLEPFNDTYLPPQGYTVSMNATRDEYEYASFAIQPSGDTSGINFTISDLSDGLGHTIPSNATDVRLVKAWFQLNEYDVSWLSGTPAPTAYDYLAPELLLKNDSIVLVNYSQPIAAYHQSGVAPLNAGWYNKLFVYNASNPAGHYVQIDANNIKTWATDWKIFDNATAEGYPQPLSLLSGENRQVWLTTKIPSDQYVGNYSGFINITSPSTTGVSLNFTIWVLPFTLETTQNVSLDYGMFYHGHMYPGDPVHSPSSNWKTATQLQLELEDVYEHGVKYPSMGNDNNTRIDEMFTIRNAVGFNQSKIHIAPGGGWETNMNQSMSNWETPAQLAAWGVTVGVYRNITETYGYGDTLFYAHDDLRCDTHNCTSWIAVFNQTELSGAGIWNNDPMQGQSTILDVLGTNMSTIVKSRFNTHGIPEWSPSTNQTEYDRWIALGNTVLTYNQPQSGVEDPEMYRKWYGLDLKRITVNGSFINGYQSSGSYSMWNDFDDLPVLRDHIFAYQTWNSVVPTIQWEGYREGIDDVRYYDKLVELDGNSTRADTIVEDGFDNSLDMSVVRSNLIAAILSVESASPTASFTADKYIVKVPGNVQFTDTSTNSPNSWNWSFGDGTYNYTQNPLHRYTRRGAFTVQLNASNPYGYDTDTTIVKGMGYSPQEFDPYGDPIYSCESLTYNVSRYLNQAERAETDTKMLIICSEYV